MKPKLRRKWVAMLSAVALLLAAAWPAGAVETVVYYHNDALGSPIGATDEAGQVLWREAYRPYGERILEEDFGTHALWYTGKPEESGFGLTYLGARWYGPGTGRFLSTDPAGFDEDNFLSFNRYAYGNDNPYRFIDPDGNTPVDAVFLAVSVGGALGAGVAYIVGKATGNDALAAVAGVGFGAAVVAVGIDALGVVSPVPGTSVAIKTAKAAGKVAKASKVTKKGPYSHLKDHPSVGEGKVYTQSQKKKILQKNMRRHGGELRSDLSGKPLVRAQQHQKGVRPPSNEAHIDHICERCAGGTNSFGNARVLSREENLRRPGRQ